MKKTRYRRILSILISFVMVTSFSGQALAESGISDASLLESEALTLVGSNEEESPQVGENSLEEEQPGEVVQEDYSGTESVSKGKDDGDGSGKMDAPDESLLESPEEGMTQSPEEEPEEAGDEWKAEDEILTVDEEGLLPGQYDQSWQSIPSAEDMDGEFDEIELRTIEAELEKVPRPDEDNADSEKYTRLGSIWPWIFGRDLNSKAAIESSESDDSGKTEISFYHWYDESYTEENALTYYEKYANTYDRENDLRPIVVEVSGYLPEDVTARGSYVELNKDLTGGNPEVPVLAMDLVLLDGEGQIYTPSEKLTIAVSGLMIHEASADEQPFLVYVYEENEDRKNALGGYAADVTVYRDQPLLRVGEDPETNQQEENELIKRLHYVTDVTEDAVRFTEDPNGLVSYEDATIGFEATDMPLHFVVSKILSEEGTDAAYGEDSKAADAEEPAFEEVTSDDGFVEVSVDEEETPDGEADALEPEEDGTEEAADGTSELSVSGSNYEISLTYGDDANIPDNARLRASELSPEKKKNKDLVEQAWEVLDITEEDIVSMTLVDLNIRKAGKKIEPEADVDIRIQVTDPDENPETEYQVVAISDTTELLEASGNDGEDSPEGTDFAITTSTMDPVYAIVEKVITKQLTASDGKTYEVKLTCKDGANIPDGAILAVGELEGEEYQNYLTQTAEALSIEEDKINYARAFDISIIDPVSGEEIEPEEDVKVSIRVVEENKDTIEGDSEIVHFGMETEVLDTAVKETEDGYQYDFVASEFSVYVVVEHEGETVITPRVEFHYIDPAYTENTETTTTEGGSEVTIYTYTAPGYQFFNKKQEHQITQILKDGETLEMITNPANKANPDGSERSFFFGWYTADLVEDTTRWDESAGGWTGAITYTWPNPQKVEDETPATIIASDTNNSGSLDAGDEVQWSIGAASGTAALDARGTAHVYLVPVYEDFKFINYHMGTRDAVSGLRNNLLARQLVVFGSSDTRLVRIGSEQCPSPDPTHQIFEGWEITQNNNGVPETLKYYKTIDKNGEEITKTLGLNGQEIESAGEGYYITVAESDFALSDIDLYPVFAEARWLFYDLGTSGNGATYVPASYLLTNEDNDGTAYKSLPTTSSPGYTFGGWFVNAAMVDSKIENLDGEYTLTTKTGEVFYSKAIQLTDGDGRFVEAVKGKVFYKTTSDTVISCAASVNVPADAIKLFEVTGDGEMYEYKALDSLTLGAKWDAKTVNYTVVYWLENANDDNYTLVTYETKQGIAGEETEAAALAVNSPVYNENNLKYAHIKSDIQQQTIEGDGSTVVNVYYDRNEYSLWLVIGVQKKNANNYYIKNTSNDSTGLKLNNWTTFITTSGRTNSFSSSTNPFTSDQYNVKQYGKKESNTDYIFYYIEVKDRFGASLVEDWPTTGVGKINDTNFNSWQVLGDSRYYNGDKNHRSIKGLYPTMSETIISTIKGETKTSDQGPTSVLLACYSSNYAYTYKYFFWDQDSGSYPTEPLSRPAQATTSWEAATIAEFEGYNYQNYEYQYDGQKNGSSWYGGTIHFYYKPKKHTLTFRTAQGDIMGTDDYYYAQSLANADTYTPTAKADTPVGYSFDGWYENPDGVGNKFKFTTTLPDGTVKNTTMPDGNIVLYAVYKPIEYMIMINPNGAEIDHIDHTGAAYGSVSAFNRGEITYTENGQTITERPADSGYNKSQATYFMANYGEQVGEYSLSRSYVPISDMAAEVYTAGGRNVYAYVNIQYLGGDVDGKWGVPIDLRSSLYVDVTNGEEELQKLYNFYHNWIDGNYESSPGWWDCDGARDLSYEAWKNTFVEQKAGGSGMQLYRKCNSQENWVFLGWFKDDESVPYNFADPVTKTFTLTAKWRLDGGYRIQYTPEYTMGNGDVINGKMEEWFDPSGGETYTDGALTSVFKQPTQLTRNGKPVTDGSLIFRGWRLVGVTTTTDSQGKTVINYTPLENGVFYDPNDIFTVSVEYADSNNIIHMQAVYEDIASSYRLPQTANLILDANSGYLTAGSTSGAVDKTELLENRNLSWEGSGIAAANADDDQILFGDIQSNAAVRLYQYASTLTRDSAGNALKKAINYFAHPLDYLLIGFDDANDEGDYIATYPADSIISVQRTDKKTLYAVWEPMVYLTFRNETAITDVFDGGDVSFSITSESTEALQVINIKEGYARKPLSNLSEITIHQGESLTLVFPKGEEATITISGTNGLGVGKQLLWSTTLEAGGKTYDESYSHGDCTHTLASGFANNTKRFSFDEKLLTHEEGLVVTFTAKEMSYALLCEDNFPGGSTQEYDYSQDYIEKASPAHEQALPNPGTRFGYEFKGWAYTANANEPVIPAEPEKDRRIDNLTTFFTDEANAGYITTVDSTKVRHLYAVWAINKDSQYVYVYKTVPEPGNQKTQFTFNVNISATYTAPGKNNTDINQPISANGSFTLAHGEHAVLYSTSYPEAGEIGTRITIYGADGTQKGQPIVLTAKPETSYANGGFKNSEAITVTENGETYYTTEVSKLAESTGHTLTVEGASVSWSAIEAGGTLLYTNTRETKDITVTKELISNESKGTFDFHASYTDGSDKTGDARTVSFEDFLLTYDSNETAHVTPKTLTVPVGAELTVTEYGTNLNDFTVTATHGASAAMSVTEAESTSGSTTTYTASVKETVRKDDTITFTNTLKSYPVKLIKVDQDGNVGKVEAFFKLDAGSHNIAKNLYANAGKASDGVFYDSGKYEPLYAGNTYTLTETWVASGYEGLKTPISIIVSGKTGNEFTFRDSEGNPVSNVQAEFKRTDSVWEIRIKNQAVKTITIRKELKDPLVNQREFTFTGSYELNGVTYGLDRKEFDSDKPYTFTLTPTTSAPANTDLLIPANATNFKVYEDTHLKMDVSSADLIKETYETMVTYSGDDTSDTTATTLTGKDSKGNDINSPTCTIAKIDNNGTITFTNTRRTVNVEISKTVISDKTEETAGDFEFEVKVLQGAIPIKGYTVNDGGTTAAADDWVTDDTGLVKLPGNKAFTLKHNEAGKTIRLPVGATLTVEEKLTDEQKKIGYVVFMTMPGVQLTFENGNAEKVTLKSPTEDKKIHVFNIPAICKVTDEEGKLLYVLQEGADTADVITDDIYIPAIYPTINGAFGGRGGIGGLGNYYQKDVAADTYSKYSAENQHQVQMLVDYTMPADDQVTIPGGRNITLTTSKASNPEGIFYYAGDSGTATITRGYAGGSMFSSAGTFTISDIILDGACTTYTSTTNGGIVNVESGGILNIQAKAVLQNSKAPIGGAVYANSSTTDGQGTVIENDTTVNMTGGTIRACEANEYGGGIAVVGTTVTMTPGCQVKNCYASKRGGAVCMFNSEAAITGGTFTGNTVPATAIGAGFYLSENSILNISGAPDFGGTDLYTEDDQKEDEIPEGKAIDDLKGEDGNYILMTGYGNKVNGGRSYPEVSSDAGSKTCPVRQDIYIDEAHENAPASIVITGDLVDNSDPDDPKALPEGSIWVWAASEYHYKQSMPFAVLGDAFYKQDENGQLLDGTNQVTTDKNKAVLQEKYSQNGYGELLRQLSVFRNARDDEITENPTDTWLTGTNEGEKGGYVYWTGAGGSRKVILRKVYGSYVSVNDKQFTVYKGSSVTPYKPKDAVSPLENLSSGKWNPETESYEGSGCFWAGELPYGWYIIKESSPQKYFYMVVTANGTYGTPLKVIENGTEKEGGYDTRANAEKDAKALYDLKK